MQDVDNPVSPLPGLVAGVSVYYIFRRVHLVLWQEGRERRGLGPYVPEWRRGERKAIPASKYDNPLLRGKRGTYARDTRALSPAYTYIYMILLWTFISGLPCCPLRPREYSRTRTVHSTRASGPTMCDKGKESVRGRNSQMFLRCTQTLSVP